MKKSGMPRVKRSIPHSLFLLIEDIFQNAIYHPLPLQCIRIEIYTVHEHQARNRGVYQPAVQRIRIIEEFVMNDTV